MQRTAWIAFGSYAVLVLAVFLVTYLRVLNLSLALSTAEYLLPLVVLTIVYQRWPANRVARWISWLWLGLYCAFLGYTAINSYTVPLGNVGFEDVERRQTPVERISLVALAVGASLALTGWWAPLVCWVSFGRTQVARDNTLVGQATVTLLYLSALAVGVQVARGGPPLDVLAAQTVQRLGNGGAGLSLAYLAGYVGLFVWSVYLALFATGFPLRRDLESAFRRLGLVPIRVRDVAPIVVLSIATTIGGYALNYAAYRIWFAAGWRLTDYSLLAVVNGPLQNPANLVVASGGGASAEEIFWRGLLVPRLGWLLPSLGFALSHADRYGPDGLVQVFLFGVAMSAIRMRWNTTVSVFVHCIYDVLLVTVSGRLS